MCDRRITKDVNGPRVVLWLTCWRRKVEWRYQYSTDTCSYTTVAIPSTSIDIGRLDSSCETGTFSTGKFAKSKTCFLILFYLISELVLYSWLYDIIRPIFY